MELEAAWIDIETGQSSCAAYRVRPGAATGPLPAVLVIQEAWGVDEHIQDVTRRVATAGYLALAPDLYTVGGRSPELVPERIAAVKRFLEAVPPAVWTDSEERQRALAALPDEERERVGGTMARLFGGRDPEEQLAALADACRTLRDDPGCDEHVGSVGWCMGGGLSARLADRETRLDAAVVFYGPPPHASEVPAITCPVLGFYGGDDPRITGAVPDLAEAMRRAGVAFEYHVYPGAPHAFFNDTRRSYRVDAARDAWARCLVFLATHLTEERS
jgi:carboxymethylenebutenolidase